MISMGFFYLFEGLFMFVWKQLGPIGLNFEKQNTIFEHP